MIFYIPDTLEELYRLLRNSKNPRIYWDDINSFQYNRIENTDCYIYLGKIKAMKTIRRTETYYEVGSHIRINKLLENGRQILPDILINALENTGLPHLRNIYTLGGMICDQSIRNKIFSALSLLNSRVEIGYSTTKGSKKLMSVQHLFSDGELKLNKGEIILNFRIPYMNYDIDYYKEIQEANHNYCFMGAATTFKRSIVMFRFVIGNWGTDILRNVNFENNFMEQKLPVSQQAIEEWNKEFSNLLKTMDKTFSPYLQQVLTNFFDDFISQL